MTTRTAFTLLAADESTDDATEGARKLLTVGRTPAPLRPLDTSGSGDSLFGDVTSERAGGLDVVLVVVGALLLAWWVLDRAALELELGLGSIVLGIAVPARDALHALDRRWSGARHRGAAPANLLDASDGTVRAAVEAYDRVWNRTWTSPATAVAPVRRWAHAAMLEIAAGLVDGRPTGQPQRDEIRRRTAALTAVDAALRRASKWKAPDQLTGSRWEERQLWLGAVEDAKAGVAAAVQDGPVAVLEALAYRIDVEAGNVGRE